MVNSFVIIVNVLVLSCNAQSIVDVENLFFKNFSRSDNVLLELDIKQNPKSFKQEGKQVYIYDLSFIYITGGLSYGYTENGPGRFYKDSEYKIEYQILISKNNWDEWYIKDDRTISTELVKEIWRPEAISLEDFYSDRILIGKSVSEKISVKLNIQSKIISEQWEKYISLIKRKCELIYNIALDMENKIPESKGIISNIRKSVVLVKNTKMTYDILDSKSEFENFINAINRLNQHELSLMDYIHTNYPRYSPDIMTDYESNENHLTISKIKINKEIQVYNSIIENASETVSQNKKQYFQMRHDDQPKVEF